MTIAQPKRERLCVVGVREYRDVDTGGCTELQRGQVSVELDGLSVPEPWIAKST